MLPGLVVQIYAFTGPDNDCVNDGSSAYYGHGVRQKVGEVWQDSLCP